MKAIQHIKGQVCIKFTHNEKEVSLAFDDSCKMMLPTEMNRVSLCIFKGEENITTSVFRNQGEVLSPSIEELILALQSIL